MGWVGMSLLVFSISPAILLSLSIIVMAVNILVCWVTYLCDIVSMCLLTGTTLGDGATNEPRPRVPKALAWRGRKFWGSDMTTALIGWGSCEIYDWQDRDTTTITRKLGPETSCKLH